MFAMSAMVQLNGFDDPQQAFVLAQATRLDDRSTDQLSSASESTSAATPAWHFVVFQLLQTREVKILYAKGT